MFKPRLQRLDRLFADHPIFFITICTEQRRPILTNSDIHREFIAFAKQAARHEIFVGKYVIMPDHIHFFVVLAANTKMTLSVWIKSLKNYLSKSLRQKEIKAPHWQKNFFDHVLRSNESYAEKWDYVAQNPVRAKLCSFSKEWLFQGEIQNL